MFLMLSSCTRALYISSLTWLFFGFFHQHFTVLSIEIQYRFHAIYNLSILCFFKATISSVFKNVCFQLFIASLSINTIDFCLLPCIL